MRLEIFTRESHSNINISGTPAPPGFSSYWETAPGARCFTFVSQDNVIWVAIYSAILPFSFFPARTAKSVKKLTKSDILIEISNIFGWWFWTDFVNRSTKFCLKKKNWSNFHCIIKNYLKLSLAFHLTTQSFTPLFEYHLLFISRLLLCLI